MILNQIGYNLIVDAILRNSHRDWPVPIADAASHSRVASIPTITANKHTPIARTLYNLHSHKYIARKSLSRWGITLV